MADSASAQTPRVCVVGPSTHFLSGITYYTYCLVEALARETETSALLMRRLLPRRLYPGRERVGAQLADISLPPEVRAFDGVDWFWLPSIARAIAFLRRERPDVLVLQWWTGTVLHSYLVLALAARALGIRIVIEFHEALDTAEDKIPVVRTYVRAGAPRLFRAADQYVVHSAFDADLVVERYGLDRERISIVPHAAYEHYRGGRVERHAPAGVCNLLYFGVIRPFKGVEDLIRAFDAIPADEIDGYWLTVVGETWEGCTEPARLIAESRYRDRITFVNRYVTDEEADALFGGADVVCLPYHRSSQSGPLHMAFAYGRPVVVTRVGGLVEASSTYDGAVLVEPGQPDDLLRGIRDARALVGRSYAHDATWPAVARRYAALLAA